MNSSLGVIAFILTLGFMVVFHEFGHYITAKKFGMKIEEFFIGFGPRLYSRFGKKVGPDGTVTRGETEYGIKAIPVGGYVKIFGMNPWQTIPESERGRTFGAKPSWQRAIVLSAGSMTHFILAIVIFTIMFGFIGLSDPNKPTTTVDSVDIKLGKVDGPAKLAGLAHGDKIVSIDGRPVHSWEDVRAQIRTHPGTQITMLVEGTNRSKREVSMTPVATDVADPAHPAQKLNVGQVGVLPTFEVIRQSPPAAFWSGIKTTGQIIGLSVTGIGKIFSPHGISKVFTSIGGSGRRTSDQPFGLVGSARLAGEVARRGQITDLIQFLTGFIVFIGVINLVPLPPLDGGHLLILLIEKINKRKVDMRKVVPVAGVVIGFFLILTFALLYLDIVRPITSPF